MHRWISNQKLSSLLYRFALLLLHLKQTNTNVITVHMASKILHQHINTVSEFLKDLYSLGILIKIQRGVFKVRDDVFQKVPEQIPELIKFVRDVILHQQNEA